MSSLIKEMANATYLYQHVILYYEQQVANNPKVYVLSDQAFEQFVKNMGIPFEVTEPNNIILPPKFYKTEPQSFFVIKPCYDNQRKRYLPIIISFLKHLRNSFSHGTYEVINLDGIEYLCVEDHYTFWKKRGQLSMVAQAPKDAFIILIEFIKSKCINIGSAE